jgi:hypothetical protein
MENWFGVPALDAGVDPQKVSTRKSEGGNRAQRDIE